MIRDKMGKTLTGAEIMSKGVNRIKNILLDFELFILYLAGLVPSHWFRLEVYRLAGLKIGRGSTIHMWARFYQPKGIAVGSDSIIGDHVFLDGRDSLKIGNHVDIASEVMIYNSEHDINSEDFHASNSPVEIGDYVFIGPRVIIMPGVKIGTGAVVAGGAVVTADIPEFAIVGGVPAKVIGERRNKKPNYKLGRARMFQ
ncbi:MAG: Acetyltransferase [Candidatus Amesbacteria bacterium GW2011_GWA2_47_11]|uniref:Acetyltransferase n=4 Tax=Candidatus Amesiibacteriota TaxID=1752730 RepID=A0A0G1XE92_9BACT|nr:MAG: Acetyltransferase [Candidatus Amesbacteria bacterium GW2011_GWA2_47_11]KKU92630.1 MAG: acetyltransferase [Candidatus Amesbacteria bacterium GW2011_GWC1_48_10]